MTSAFLGSFVGLLVGYFTKAIFGTIIFPISTILFACIGLKLDTVFRTFNKFYAKVENAYQKLLDQFLKRRKWVSISLLPLALLTIYLFRITPTGLIPQEDMGNLFGLFYLNPGASITAVEPVSNQVRSLLNDQNEGNQSGISDYVLIDQTDGSAILYVTLLPLDQRRKITQKIQETKGILSS